MIINNSRDLWTGNHIHLFYLMSGSENFCFCGYSKIYSFDYKSKEGTCSYCGHEIEPGKECPGCAARKTRPEKLVAGEAIVKIYGMLPFGSWLFNNPNKIEAHICEFGIPDVFNNWDARIVMSNIQPINQSIIGFDEANVLTAVLEINCDIQIEEREAVNGS